MQRLISGASDLFASIRSLSPSEQRRTVVFDLSRNIAQLVEGSALYASVSRCLSSQKPASTQSERGVWLSMVGNEFPTEHLERRMPEAVSVAIITNLRVTQNQSYVYTNFIISKDIS